MSFQLFFWQKSELQINSSPTFGYDPQFLAQENKVNKKRFQLISETFTGIDFPFVARPRVELGTLGLWILRSNQLSYLAIYISTL